MPPRRALGPSVSTRMKWRTWYDFFFLFWKFPRQWKFKTNFIHFPFFVQVREFASFWKAGIQQINDDVLAYFATCRNGMDILKQVLTQLLLYYTRFQDIIKKTWSRAPAFTRDIVSTATILMEIKRYSRMF